MPGQYDRVVYEVPAQESYRSSNSYLGRDTLDHNMDSGSTNGSRYRGAESYLSSSSNSSSSFANRYGQSNTGSASSGYQSRGSYGSSAGYGSTTGAAMGSSYSRGVSASYASGSSLGSVSRFDSGSRGYGGSSAYEGTSGYSSNSSAGYGSISSHGSTSNYRGSGASPWQGGMVGSGAATVNRGDGILPSPRATSMPMRQGSGGSGSNIAGAVNQLKQMGNPESEMALNILNAVLAQQGGDETRRDWGGAPPNKMRRMDWDEGRGRTLSPSMRAPAMRKFPQQVWDNEPPQLARASRPYGSAGHQMMANDPFRKVAKARRGKPNKGPANQQRGRNEGAAAAAAKTSEGQKRKISEGDSSSTAGPKQSNVMGDGMNAAAANNTSVEDIPNEALKCHMCSFDGFINVGAYIRHLQSKEHAVSTKAYHTQGAAILQLLRHEAKLVAQRNIVKGRQQNMKGRNQNLPYCAKCQCRIGGSLDEHQKSIEHLLINQYMRVKCCGRMYSVRGELEEHRLTLQHLKFQENHRKMRQQPTKRDEEAEAGTEDVTEEEALEMFREAVKEHQDRNKEQPFTPDTLPPYDSSKPLGLFMLGIRSHYRCNVCPEFRSRMETEEHVLKHYRSVDHYQNMYSHLVTQQLEKKKEADEKKKEAAKKKAEEEQANPKKEEEMEVTAEDADQENENESKNAAETVEAGDEVVEDEEMKETENATEGEGKEAVETKVVGEGEIEDDDDEGEDEAAVEGNENVVQEEDDEEEDEEEQEEPEDIAEEGGEEHAMAEEAMDEVGEELEEDELDATEDPEEEEEL